MENATCIRCKLITLSGKNNKPTVLKIEFSFGDRLGVREGELMIEAAIIYVTRMTEIKHADEWLT